MAKRKTVSRNVILPPYIVRGYGNITLDGYTWKELAHGYYDGRLLPCPLCGEARWTNDKCPNDGQPYPTIERALKGCTKAELIRLIHSLALAS